MLRNRGLLHVYANLATGRIVGAEMIGPDAESPLDSDTTIGGIVAACRQLKTRKGDRMAVFTLEDAHGSVEVITFPEAYQRAAAFLEIGTMVLVRVS